VTNALPYLAVTTRQAATNASINGLFIFLLGLRYNVHTGLVHIKKDFGDHHVMSHQTKTALTGTGTGKPILALSEFIQSQQAKPTRILPLWTTSID
jgi:hypothetical protein